MKQKTPLTLLIEEIDKEIEITEKTFYVEQVVKISAIQTLKRFRIQAIQYLQLEKQAIEDAYFGGVLDRLKKIDTLSEYYFKKTYE